MMPRSAWPLCTSPFRGPPKETSPSNRAELASRSEATTVQKLMGLVKKGPDVASAAKIGEPTFGEYGPGGAKPSNSKRVPRVARPQREEHRRCRSRHHKPQSARRERIDATAGCDSRRFTVRTSCRRHHASPCGSQRTEAQRAARSQRTETDRQRQRSGAAAAPQVNEIQPGAYSSSASASADNSAPASDEDISSSKKKKKKGLKKIIPF